MTIIAVPTQNKTLAAGVTAINAQEPSVIRMPNPAIPIPIISTNVRILITHPRETVGDASLPGEDRIIPAHFAQQPGKVIAAACIDLKIAARKALGGKNLWAA
jgi:hypothetical protein